MKFVCLFVTSCCLTACLATDERITDGEGEGSDLPVSVDSRDFERVDFDSPFQNAIDRGEYMVDLLGCGSCHTNGAIVGMADPNVLLSGSDVGIAFTTPLLYRHPGVVYVPNITPDKETGIGHWTKRQIVDAIRDGQNLHGIRQGQIMPWEGYAILTDQDAYALAAYLQSIPAIRHRVPNNVAEGEEATEPYIYLGVYEQN